MPFIEVNETRLFYQETGAGRRTVVLAHGLLLNQHMFEEQISTLYGRYRVISYDHRGQGQSDNPPTGEDLDTLTEDAAALIQALCPEPVHFVGMSMGGMVGLRLAVRYPQLLRSLNLIDTSAAPESFFAQRKYRFLCWATQFIGVKPFTGITMRLMFGKSSFRDETKAELLQQWREYFQNLPVTIVRQIRGVMLRGDFTAELAKIKCPTLVICGEEDSTTPIKYSKQIAKLIPEARLVSVANAGHCSNLEQPSVVNLALIRQFESMDGTV
ncbi:MAG: alpha/beta hydrolase [Arenimonas sp.]